MEVGDLGDTFPMEEKEQQRLLGSLWDPKSDSLCFKVTNNLSPLKKKFHAGPDLTRRELLDSSQGEITCCQYYILAGAVPL